MCAASAPMAAGCLQLRSTTASWCSRRAIRQNRVSGPQERSSALFLIVRAQESHRTWSLATGDYESDSLPADAYRKNDPDLSQVTLRPFEANDLPALLHLDARCFPPQISYSRAELQYFVRHPRSTTTIAEAGGQI